MSPRHFNQMIVREAGISAIINMAISAAFYVVLFRNDPVVVAGPGNFAFDFLPQAFMVALMGSLVPGLLARGRMSADARPRQAIILRALAVAAVALVLAGGGLCAALLTSGLGVLSWSAGLSIKLVFALLLSAVVTPLAIRHAVGPSVVKRR